MLLNRYSNIDNPVETLNPCETHTSRNEGEPQAVNESWWLVAMALPKLSGSDEGSNRSNYCADCKSDHQSPEKATAGESVLGDLIGWVGKLFVRKESSAP
jgi:hypothetical protein